MSREWIRQPKTKPRDVIETASRATRPDLRRGLPTDPESLNREMLTILLAFNRFAPAQLAAAFGLALDDVDRMRQDPDVVELVSDIRGLLPRPGDINELLMSDAERNIRWLRKVREGTFDKVDAKLLRVRTDAAKTLLDRQVPKKVAVSIETTRAIDVTPMQVERMRKLLAAPVDEIEEADA